MNERQPPIGFMLAIRDVKLGERKREEYGDVAGLANDMAEIGQLQPVIVMQDNTLAAGGRRIAAAIYNKWTEVWAIRKDEVTPKLLRRIELSENIHRKQMTWQEEQKAVKELHLKSIEDNPKWSADDTAAMIHKSRRYVYNALELAEAVEKHEDVNKAESQVGAMQRLQRIKQIDKRKRDVQVKNLAIKLNMAFKSDLSAMIVEADAVQAGETFEDNSLDVVFMNPPYGVGIEKTFKTQQKIYGPDEPEPMTQLMEKLVDIAYRKLKPDHWLVIFWPTMALDLVMGSSSVMQHRIDRILHNANVPQEIKSQIKQTMLGALARSGFNFQHVPSVWYKPAGKYMSGLSDPQSMLTIKYETFFFARKGNAKWNEIHVGNVFCHDSVATDDRVHALQMNPDVWYDVLGMVALPGETVIEFCAGSGVGGVAAVRRRMNYYGIELDPEFVSSGNMLIQEELLKIAGPKNTPAEPGVVLLEEGEDVEVPF